MIFKKGIATILSTATLLTAVSPCAFAKGNNSEEKNTKSMSTTGKVLLGAAGAVGLAATAGIIYHVVNNSPVDIEKLDKKSTLYKAYKDLEFAIRDANWKKVGEIFRRNPSLNANARTSKGHTLLTYACYVFTVKNLLKTDSQRFGQDRLTLECCNLLSICSKLLEHGARVDVRDKFPSCGGDSYTTHERTPLHYAAGSGSTSLCCILLYYGADINARTTANGIVDDNDREFGYTPLNIAAAAPMWNDYASTYPLRDDLDDRLYEVCDLLIKEGAKARYCLGDFKDLSISDSARLGCYKTCKLLIEKMNSICKTNVDIKPTLNDALLSAINEGQYDIYKLLIDNGADVNYTYINRNTLLHYAANCLKFNSKICESLIKKGVNINALNDKKQTPLDYISENTWPPCFNEEKEKIMKWLIDHGAKHGYELK